MKSYYTIIVFNEKLINNENKNNQKVVEELVKEFKEIDTDDYKN
jgi:hypothetical protein